MDLRCVAICVVAALPLFAQVPAAATNGPNLSAVEKERALGERLAAHLREKTTAISSPILQNFIDPSKYGLPQLVQRMKMILVAFLEEMEEVTQRRLRSRRLATLEEESGKVLALLVRQLFLASRDWSLARRIGSPDPRQLLEWRVVVHALEELADLFGATLRTLNEDATQIPEAGAAALGVYLPELKAQLKSVVDALIRPSLDRACDVYHQGSLLGGGNLLAPSRGRSVRSPAALRTATLLLERGAGCLSLLAEIAIDRAVAGGTETILVEAA